MKKMGFFILLVCICMLVGCARPYSGGLWFSEIDVPMSSPDDSSGLQVGSKVGTSEMINYLGLIATGNASIQAAAKNGGIRHIKTADFHYKSILGIVNTTTTTVTGD